MMSLSKPTEVKFHNVKKIENDVIIKEYRNIPRRLKIVYYLDQF